MSKICDAFMFSANPSFLDAIIAVTKEKIRTNMN